MARRDSALISEWPFSKLLIAVFERPEASANSCCVQPRIPRAPLHCSIVSMLFYSACFLFLCIKHDYAFKSQSSIEKRTVIFTKV